MLTDIYPARRALELIDGTLATQLAIKRIDGPERTKAQFFETTEGRQFAVITGDLDKASKPTVLQTRILFEEQPPEIANVARCTDFYVGNSVNRSFSKLAPPHQHSVLVSGDAALEGVLSWYADRTSQEPRSTSDQPAAQVLNSQRIGPMEATNVIFYGPPGTGKTYITASRAVELCDGSASTDRAKVLSRYEALRREGRIRFVTFHQSFGYEDFVEGLRPENVDGQTVFQVRPGIFRDACDAAKRSQLVSPGLGGTPLRKRSVYKMSLGARSNDSGMKVFQDALESGCLLLGWGQDVDFTGCADQDAIRAKIQEEKPNIDRPDSQAQFVNIFINELQVGDIVVVSNGNLEFRGLAEVTGEYTFREDSPTFHQSRSVKWLAVLETNPKVREIYDRDFVQRSLYRLSRDSLNYERLEELLHDAEQEPAVKPHVLIIDEINRANISKVFGELITLLEPDKREGAGHPLTVKLPYSGDDFSVPGNLNIIGTMNTADRSIALLDTALRRRFDFEELKPQPQLLANHKIEGIDLAAMLTALNRRVEALYDRDHMIGHAYLMSVDSLPKLQACFRRKVLPLLQEYFHENLARVAHVLNDKVGAFVMIETKTTFSTDVNGFEDEEIRRTYAVNPNAFDIEAFRRIYDEA